ncbi:MAG: CoA transferase [Bacteroidetes bacterium]|jgi:crotonobetainyl-CoA:carnitine CoA-transferase CaiB-like acyl-CoA transferase|nr:CoA transferase [Bacteroidota bacterium]
MQGMFQGLKVLDLSTVLAGPLTGTFLAEGGARVLKVEPPLGDVTRTWKSHTENHEGTSAYYESANEGKEVFRVDLKTPQGQHWLKHELEETDVLIQNMKWQDLQRMGLMPDVLARDFPRLVHARLVGYEWDAERLAYDVVVQAETGFMAMNGHPEAPPCRLPVALMDILASHQLRCAVLSGLWKRAEGFGGCYAEVSLLGSGLTALANQGTAVLMNHVRPQRMGSQHPHIAPYGDLLPTLDGQVVLAVGSDVQFTHLCEVLGLEELAHDAKFSNNTRRLEHRKELMDVLSKASQSLSRQELLKALHQAKVPAGAVFHVDEALNEPRVQDAYVVGEPGRRKVRTSAFQLTHLSPQLLP